MSKANITTSVRRSNGASIIDVGGDVNSAAEDALTNAFNQASESGAKVILLSFSGLEYMNSSGIGLLVTLLIRANRHKQKLLACGLSDHYKQIFELTRLNEAISVFDSESEALRVAVKH